jgi:hypothetical protein
MRKRKLVTTNFFCKEQKELKADADSPIYATDCLLWLMYFKKKEPA